MQQETTERKLPFLLGSVAPVAFLCAWWSGWSPSGANLRSAFEAVAGFGGAVVGFLLTAKSLLFTVPESRTSRFLGPDGFRTLTEYLMTDVWVWLTTSALSVILIFAAPPDGVPPSPALNVALAGWCYLASVGGLTLRRSAKLVGKLVRRSFDDR